MTKVNIGGLVLPEGGGPLWVVCVRTTADEELAGSFTTEAAAIQQLKQWQAQYPDALKLTLYASPLADA